MTNVLLTGGAGFIGSNLAYYLREHRPDWSMTILDSLTYAGNLSTLAPLLEKKEVGFERIDIRDRDKLVELFSSSSFDIVFHLAAESHVDRSIHSAGEFITTNAVGTQNLLDVSVESKVGRFVHISTDEVYGSLGPTGKFHETTPLDPTSPYAASKAASDLLVLAVQKTHGLNAVITRCTNNYGPYQFPEKFIPLFISNSMEGKELPLYGDGMNVRSWLYVTDHCDALLRVAEKGKSGEVYNIGGDDDAEIPNKVVAQMILERVGASEDLIKLVTDRKAHDRRYAVDFSKIQSELGWEPTISFGEGLTRTVEWYRGNRPWWEEIKTGEYLKFYEKHYSL